jgi:hypothetical protein
MTDEQPYGEQTSVRTAVESMLRAVLPTDLHPVVARLAEEAAERPGVAEHVGKRWGELSESEANIVARDVGIVSRRFVAIKHWPAGDAPH